MKPTFVEREQRFEFWPVAVVRISPERILEAGYEIGRDQDDLDDLSFADIADATTGPIILQVHDQSPCRFFNVDASTEFSRRDVLLRLEQALNCREEDYEWITPYPVFPGYAAGDRHSALIARDVNGEPFESMPWTRRLEEPRAKLLSSRS